MPARPSARIDLAFAVALLLTGALFAVAGGQAAAGANDGPTRNYKRWARDTVKVGQRALCIDRAHRWLGKPPSEWRVLHLPGGDAAETLAFLRAGVPTPFLTGLERDPAIAAQAHAALHRDEQYQALLRAGQPEIEIIVADANDLAERVKWHIFDILSLDYPGPYDREGLATLGNFAGTQRADRWLLHVAHLGKRDPGALRVLRHAGREVAQSELATRDVKHYYGTDHSAPEWNEKLSREQRGRALLEMYRTAMSLRLLYLDNRPALAHLSRYELRAVTSMLRTFGFRVEGVPPRRRWREMVPQIERAAAECNVSTSGLVNITAEGIAAGLFSKQLRGNSQKRDVDYLLASLRTYGKDGGFTVPEATTYTYTSDTSAPMVGFMARVERTPKEFLRALDKLADVFGLHSTKPKLPATEALLSRMIELARLDPGLIVPTSAIDFVDLGGKGRPRLTRERAIEAYREGASTEDLLDEFQVSEALARSLPAIKAHVTMGTYDGEAAGSEPAAAPPVLAGEGEAITRAEAIEWLKAGFTAAEIARAHPGSNVRTIAAWAAHLTMGTYDSADDASAGAGAATTAVTTD